MAMGLVWVRKQEPEEASIIQLTPEAIALRMY